MTDRVVAWLAEHGATLYFGTTVVLLAGCLAMLLHRSPFQRRRLGVLTALGTSLYLVLGAVPLPRLPLHDWLEQGWLDHGAGHVEAARSDALPAALPAALPPVDPALRAAALQRALAGLELELAPPPTPLPVTSPRAAWRPAIAWPTLLACAYLLGFLFFLVRHLVGRARLRHLLSTCLEMAPASAGLVVPAGARLLLAPHGVRPFCTGVVRPVIVLPSELMQLERRSELRAVLAHEASHLRAGDSRVAALLALLAIPLFCHPLWWWLCREVRFCNELLADDDAAGHDRNAYARALLDLAEHDQPGLVVAGTVAVFHRPSEFYRRIQMLLQRHGCLSAPTSRLRRAMHALAALCLVGTVASLFGTAAAAQEPSSRAARKEKEADLRDTIAALRAELDELRALLAAQHTPPPSLGDLLKTRWIEQPALAPPSLNRPTPGNPEKADDWETVKDQLPPSAFLVQQAYVVQKGDTLKRIAEKRLGNASRQAEILQLNPGLDPSQLRAGQKLMLPGAVRDPVTLPTLNQLYAPSPEPPSEDLPTLPASPGWPTELWDHSRFDPNLPRGRGMPADAPSPANATEDLASRYLDLQGAIEIAEVAAAETRTLTDAGQSTQLESRKAAVNLRTLQKKFAIVQRLLDGEIAATEAEIEWLGGRIEASDANERVPLTIQRNRARTRLEALHTVK